MVRITFIRTSCVLIEWEGTTLLTDPWFSRRMRFLPALTPPGVALSAVPVPDAILCSHLHADHYDRRAIRQLARGTTTLVGPVGLHKHRPRDFRGSLLEMSPGETVSLSGASVAAVRMRHTFPPPEEIGYLITLGEVRIFFAGDAAYSSYFNELGKKGVVDIALLPVGGTRIWGRRTVMNAEEAGAAARDLGARFVIPLHPGGDWPSLPPMSRHPGRLSDVARLVNPGFEPVVLSPGDDALFVGGGGEVRREAGSRGR